MTGRKQKSDISHDIVNLDYKVMPDFTRGNGSTKQEVKKSRLLADMYLWGALESLEMNGCKDSRVR